MMSKNTGINAFNWFWRHVLSTCLAFFVLCPSLGHGQEHEDHKNLIKATLTRLSEAIHGPLAHQYPNKNEIPIQYVHNFDEFKQHVLLHRQRCIELAQELFKSNPIILEFLNTEFGHDQIAREKFIQDAIDFVSQHDEAKINEHKWFLKITNYKFTESVPRILYQHFWHRNLDQTDQVIDKLGVTGKEFIAEMNRLDDIIGIQFLLSRGYYNEATNQMSRHGMFLKWLEKLVDLVDRGSNPTSSEEFNKKMRKASSMFYLKETAVGNEISQFHKELLDAERTIFGAKIVSDVAILYTRAQSVAYFVSHDLENKYKHVTRNLNLPKLSPIWSDPNTKSREPKLCRALLL